MKCLIALDDLVVGILKKEWHIIFRKNIDSFGIIGVPKILEFTGGEHSSHKNVNSRDSLCTIPKVQSLGVWHTNISQFIEFIEHVSVSLSIVG